MKRIKSLVLLIAFIMALSCSAAAVELRASYYLSGYLATISPGDNSGEIIVSYSVDATGTMSKVGVDKIVLHRTDGLETVTVYGTKSNGLIETSTFEASGDYVVTELQSGYSYYAVVTVFAMDSTGSDARAITTRTVKVP